jgi:hypothetical protein
MDNPREIIANTISENHAGRPDRKKKITLKTRKSAENAEKIIKISVFPRYAAFSAL